MSILKFQGPSRTNSWIFLSVYYNIVVILYDGAGVIYYLTLMACLVLHILVILIVLNPNNHINKIKQNENRMIKV